MPGLRALGSLARLAPLVALLAGCEPAAVPPSGDAGTSCEVDDDCADGRYCNGVERCAPGSAAADERGCIPSAAPCPAVLCDEVAGRCSGSCATADADGDGSLSVACGGADCDDADPGRSPAQLEVCDGDDVDEDCDPTTFGARDSDGDGLQDAACCNASASGASFCGTDCDDAHGSVSPRATEACNAIDDDCDGAIDEGVAQLAYPDLDGDGYATDDAAAAATAICGTVAGLAVLRGDCDDDAPGRSPAAPEVCNGIDDDCSAAVDDIVRGAVACVAGSSRPCVTGCGVMGSAACRADCLGFEACIGDEICNGCDDDVDGARDETFECERAVARACTTACGTAGLARCTEACTAEPCVAPESCNYCDDDGLNGFSDERGLAVDGELARPFGEGGTALGDASVAVTTDPRSGDPVRWDLVLLPGARTPEVGGYFVDLGQRVGWGAVTVEVTILARVGTASAAPLGGWSIALLTDGVPTALGSATDLGVPSTAHGARADWWWGAASATGTYDAVDRVGFRALDGISFLVRGAGANMPTYAFPVASTPTPIRLDAAASPASVTQSFVLAYTPENPHTASREERVELRTANGAHTIPMALPPGMVVPGGELLPDDDLPIGAHLYLGIAAASYAGLGVGAPVRATVHLRSVPDPRGTPPPAATISRASICPGT